MFRRFAEKQKVAEVIFFSLVRKSAVIPSARDGFESRPHRKKQFSIELLFVFYGIYRLHIAEPAGWFLLHRLYQWFASAIIGAQFRRIRLHIGKDALGSCLFREVWDQNSSDKKGKVSQESAEPFVLWKADSWIQSPINIHFLQMFRRFAENQKFAEVIFFQFG